MTYVYPSGTNVMIPTVNAEATGGLVVEFSRAPDKFTLNKYTQLQPTQVEAGKYWRFNPDAMARVTTEDGSQFAWADGTDRPAPNLMADFEFAGFQCRRKDYGFRIGDLAQYHAQKASGVDLTGVNARMAAGAAMLQRTRIALAKGLDKSIMPGFNLKDGTNSAASSGNFSSGQPIPATASVSGGGLYATEYWDLGTPSGTTKPYFRRGVNSIAALISQRTNNVVEVKDIQMVMGPDTAIALGSCPEVLDFIKQSPVVEASLKQDGLYNKYGMPSQIFGMNVICEEASYIPAPAFGSNTGTRTWCFPFGTILFASRPGGIEGAPVSFSTLMGFFLEEMTVEQWDDPKNRRVDGHVVENFDYVITSPPTGFIIEKAVSGSA